MEYIEYPFCSGSGAGLIWEWDVIRIIALLIFLVFFNRLRITDQTHALNVHRKIIFEPESGETAAQTILDCIS